MSYKPIVSCTKQSTSVDSRAFLKYPCSLLVSHNAVRTTCFGPALDTMWILLHWCLQRVGMFNGTSKTWDFTRRQKAVAQPWSLGLKSISSREYMCSCMTSVWETKHPWTLHDFKEQTGNTGRIHCLDSSEKPLFFTLSNGTDRVLHQQHDCCLFWVERGNYVLEVTSIHTSAPV